MEYIPTILFVLLTLAPEHWNSLLGPNLCIESTITQIFHLFYKENVIFQGLLSVLNLSLLVRLALTI